MNNNTHSEQQLQQNADSVSYPHDSAFVALSEVATKAIPARYAHIDFTPPDGARDAAKRSLEVRASKPASQRGMTPVGLARARDLIAGKRLSPQTVRRMHAYFTRHEVDKKGRTWDQQGKGWQAWMGWGGDAGQSFARKVVGQMEAADRKSRTKASSANGNAEAGGRVKTGLMIGLFLEPETAKRLALPDGEAPENLHITLCYCGDAQELGHIAVMKVLLVGSQAALAFPSMQGKIGGMGRFRGSESSGGNDVLYAVPDIPNLAELRQWIADTLSEMGIPPMTNHGWNPHITLAYVNPASPDAQMPPDLELRFDRLTVCIGVERFEFEFMGSDATSEKALAGEDGPQRSGGSNRGQVRNWNARAGQTIVGNLARGADGKFASAGSASAPAAPERTFRTPGKPPEKPGKSEEPKKQAAAKPKKAGSDQAAKRAQREAERQKREAERKAQQEKREAERQAAAAKREEEKKKKAAEQAAKRAAAASKPKAGKAEKKPKTDAQQKAQEKRENNRTSVLSEMSGKGGLNESAAKELLSLADTGSADEGMLQSLADETGLTIKTDDGFVLSPAGLAYVRALNSGNVEAARRAMDKGKQGVSKAKSAIHVFKDKRGQYRWVMLSSNAFQDRDKEIISTKALVDDVARTDIDGLYGPLRFWHVGNPDPRNTKAPWGKGIDLGDCDFRAVDGRVLIESGTFKSEKIGAAVARVADKYQGSIGFMHPAAEPIVENGVGIFYTIKTFERSLVPVGRAANPYTRLTVKGGAVNEEKIKALKELLQDEEVVAAVRAEALGIQQKATSDGVAFKEDAPTGSMPESTVHQPFMVINGQKMPLPLPMQFVPTATVHQPEVAETTKEAPMEAKAEEGGAGGEMEEGEGGEGAEVEEVYVADLTANEFGEMLTKVLVEALQPVMAGLNVEAKMLEMQKKMGGYMEEMKGMVGGYMTKKDDETAQVNEQLTVAAKAAQDATQRVEELQSQLKEAKENQDKLEASLKELMGETPRAYQGYRPSQAENTVINDGHRLKGAGPQSDPLAGVIPQESPAAQFIQFIAGGVAGSGD